LLPVIWENLADPIITGREELGFAKVFADLSWNWNGAELQGGAASWFGEQFFQFEISKSSNDAVMQPGPALGAAFPSALLHHRYIPSVDRRGEASVDEFTCTPAAPAAQPIERSLVPIEFAFNASSWQALPTLWHIVSKIADLQLGQFAIAEVMRLSGGSDLAEQSVLP